MEGTLLIKWCFLKLSFIWKTKYHHLLFKALLKWEKWYIVIASKHSMLEKHKNLLNVLSKIILHFQSNFPNFTYISHAINIFSKNKADILFPIYRFQANLFDSMVYYFPREMMRFISKYFPKVCKNVHVNHETKNKWYWASLTNCSNLE